MFYSAFIIVVCTGKVLSYIVIVNKWAKCDNTSWIKNDPEAHNYMCSMEADSESVKTNI